MISLITSSWFWEFLPTLPRHVYANALCHTCLCVFIWEEIFIQPSPNPAAVLPQVSLLDKENQRDRERETLCHCRVRDYKLNCALLDDMSAQQLPASDIRGEESMKKEREAREAVYASSAINLALFVCSKLQHVASASLSSQRVWLIFTLCLVGRRRSILFRSTWIANLPFRNLKWLSV